MKDQAKTPIIIVASLLLVAVLIYFGMQVMKSGDLDQGQVKYNPGVPPGMEGGSGKSGPAGAPAINNSPGAPSGSVASASNPGNMNQPGTAPQAVPGSVAPGSGVQGQLSQGGGASGGQNPADSTKNAGRPPQGTSVAPPTNASGQPALPPGMSSPVIDNGGH